MHLGGVSSSQRCRRARTLGHPASRLPGARVLDRTSAEEIEAEDVPECCQAVAPADFFPLGVRASGVADRHLEDARTGTREARRNLRLEAEAIRNQWEGARQVATYRLVA